MADISDINSALPIKVIGSDATGAEQTPVQSSPNGELLINNTNNNGGVQGAISVSTTAVAARVGGSNLANRQTLTIYNNGTQTLFWGVLHLFQMQYLTKQIQKGLSSFFQEYLTTP